MSYINEQLLKTVLVLDPKDLNSDIDNTIKYRLKENKWIKIESEMWWFKPIRCFLERGDKNHENDFLEKKNRRVLQIYKSNCKSLKNIIIRYKNDKTLGYKVKDKSCEYLSNYYIINHTFFNSGKDESAIRKILENKYEIFKFEL